MKVCRAEVRNNQSERTALIWALRCWVVNVIRWHATLSVHIRLQRCWLGFQVHGVRPTSWSVWHRLSAAGNSSQLFVCYTVRWSVVLYRSSLAACMSVYITLSDCRKCPGWIFMKYFGSHGNSSVLWCSCLCRLDWRSLLLEDPD